MPKIFLDCTETFLTGGITGIRRVTRQIIAHRKVVEQMGPYEALPVVFSDGGFHLIDPELLFAPTNTRVSLIKRLRANVARNLSAWLTACKLDLILSLLNRIIETKLLDRLFTNRKKLGRPLGEIMTPGDVLLICEYNCACDLRFEIENFHQSGGLVASIIHDLLPLTHPELFESAGYFLRMFSPLVAMSDVVLSVSMTTKRNVDAYREMLAASGQVIARQSSTHIRLGCDLGAVGNPDSHIKSDLRWERAFGHKSVFLVCGTIEIRKNHSLVLDAFDKLWSKGEEVCLVFIGNYGWKTNDLVHRLNKHPNLNKQLFIFSRCSDGELRFAYQKSRALIFASKAEGFGLPLVEALNFRLPVICSDIPIFREVANNAALFFNLNSSDDLADKVTGFLTGKYSATKETPFKWPTWEESMIEMFSKLLAETSRLNSKN